MDDFDRDFKRFTGAAIGLWIVGSLISLAVTIVIIWAIVKVVLHFT